MRKLYSATIVPLLLACAGAALFIPGLGGVHLFDWDEINFAEIAREMVVTGDWLTPRVNYEPFWEKPPLFMWLQAIMMSIFGINEFAARLPNALCGVVTLIIVYNTGRKLYDKNFGLLWALAFAGSFLPHLYFMSGIIDPVFNLFIFLSVMEMFRWATSVESLRHAVLSGLFAGLAIITKGPVALLILALCAVIVLLFYKRAVIGKWFTNISSWYRLTLFVLCFLAACFLFFGLELLRHGTWFFREFYTYQVRLLTTEDAGHGGPFYYHVVVLLFGCLPASVIAIPGFFRQDSDSSHQREFKRWIVVLFWVVLLLFSLVKTKIVHYSSLCYFPLTYLAAYCLWHIGKGNLQWKKGMSFILAITGGFFALVLIAIPFVMMNKEALYPYIHDDFAIACLGAEVRWTGFEVLPGLFYLAAIISFLVLMHRKRFWAATATHFAVTALCTNVSVRIFIPKAEQYSQRSVIEFWKEFQGKECYISPLGFKSYAHLFYARVVPPVNTGILFGLDYKSRPAVEQGPVARNGEEMLSIKTDKPAFFVAKVTDAVRFTSDELEITGEQNGYVFYRK